MLEKVIYLVLKVLFVRKVQVQVKRVSFQTDALGLCDRSAAVINVELGNPE